MIGPSAETAASTLEQELREKQREDKETTTMCSCSKLPISLATGLPTTIYSNPARRLAEKREVENEA